MHNKIELHLANTTQHEFHVESNLLGAFGAVLVARNSLIAHAR